MHDIEPYYRWLNVYDSTKDKNSPFYGKKYNYTKYTENIYGYYIDPAWDFMGSETLYVKVLFTDYDSGTVVIELIGEWNDTLNNDIMHLKRNVIDHFMRCDIKKYVLIGENVLNFHGSDDSYYEEWFEDVEEGWIAAVNFQDHVLSEWSKYNVDTYINTGGKLQLSNWRTLSPTRFIGLIDEQIQKRLSI